MTARTRDRLLDMAAPVLSVLVHVALIYFVMDIAIGATSASIFTTRQPTPAPVRVYRSNDDLIVDKGSPSESAPSRPAEPRDPALAPPDKLTPPPEPADTQLTQPADVQATLDAAAAPDAEAAPTSPGPAIDLSTDLLALAEPSISLPAFHAAADGPTTAPPSNATVPPDLASVDPVSLRRLKDLLGRPAVPAASITDRTGATRPGAAGPAAPDSAAALDPARLPPPPLAPIADATPPTIDRASLPPSLFDSLPDLSQALAPPPAIQPTEHLDADFDYTLYTLPELPAKTGILESLGLGDKPDPNEPGYFEVRIAPRRSLNRLTALHKDVVWVIDRSGSIDQFWSAAIQRGVSSALDTLNEGDRFNILAFQDTVSVLSPEAPLEAAPRNLQAARDFLTRAQRGGWTDVNRALGRLLVRSMPPDRVYQIILISDGRPTRGALDPRVIINQITRENDLVGSIYAVAVGDPVDRDLLEYLTYRNKGYVLFPKDPEAAAAAIRDLAGRLRYPLVKSASFSALGVDADSIYPRVPRDIYQADTLSLFGRYDRRRDRTLSMQLVGLAGANRYDLTFHLEIPSARPAPPDLARRWATWKLHHLYSLLIQQGESKALSDQINDLRRKYKLDKR